MKNLLRFFLLLLIVGCSENSIIEEIAEDSSSCFNIIAISSYVPECGGTLNITVVPNRIFEQGGNPNPSQRILVCVNEANFEFNDFRLSELVCDLSIYQ